MKTLEYLAFVLCLVVTVFPAAYAENPATAVAEMRDSSGDKVGAVSFFHTPHGVLISAELTGLPAGVHAFHIHSVGTCEPPFKSAGGHFNPEGKAHGIFNPDGMHAGDLPNIHVGESGRLAFEVLAGQVTLGEGKNGLFDGDGSAIVIHEGPDDYRSDPAGSAGPRIACGVISRK